LYTSCCQWYTTGQVHTLFNCFNMGLRTCKYACVGTICIYCSRFNFKRKSLMKPKHQSINWKKRPIHNLHTN